MEKPDSRAARQEAQKLWEKACALIKEELILHENQGRKAPGFWTRLKLKRAVKLYEKIITLVPTHWNSMWFIGKTLQRLGDENAAFEWFVKAWDLNPGNVDVAREASLSAMHLGLGRHAVEYCEEALKIEPANPGLVCNLALALLYEAQLEKSLMQAQKARTMDSKDTVIENVVRVIQHIINSNAPCPKKSGELDAYCKAHRNIFR